MKLSQIQEASYSSANKKLSAKQVVAKFFIPIDPDDIDNVEYLFDEGQDLQHVQIFKARENIEVTGTRQYDDIEVEFVVYMGSEWFKLDLAEGMASTDPSGFRVIETRVLYEP